MTLSPKPTVLVVDDETGILETLEILLRSEGFAPHVAHGGRAGLEALERGNHDIVLTDVRMPQVTASRSSRPRARTTRTRRSS